MSSLRRRMSEPSRRGRPDSCQDNQAENTRRRERMERELEANRGRASQVEREGRERRGVRRDGQEKEEKEGKERKRERQEGEKGEKRKEEQELRRRFRRKQKESEEKEDPKSEGSVADLWVYRAGSQCSHQEEGKKKGEKDAQKEEERCEQLHRGRQQWTVKHGGGSRQPVVGRDFRGDSKNSSCGQEGPWGADGIDDTRDAEATPNICRYHDVRREERGTGNSPSVLQEPALSSSQWRTIPGSLDPIMVHRHGTMWEDRRVCGRAEPEAEVNRHVVYGDKLEHLAKSRDSSSRERAVILEAGSPSRSKRECRRHEGQESDQRRKRQRQARRQIVERRTKGRSQRKGQGKERTGERWRERRTQEGLLRMGVRLTKKLLEKGVSRGAKTSPEKEEDWGGRERKRLRLDERNFGGPFASPKSWGKPTTDFEASGSVEEPLPVEMTGQSYLAVEEPSSWAISPSDRQVASLEVLKNRTVGRFADRCRGGRKLNHPADFHAPFVSHGEKKEGCESDGTEGKKRDLSDLVGHSFHHAIPFIESSLLKIKLEHGKTKPTGDVFPLPTSLDEIQGVANMGEDKGRMLRCLCMGLNSYAGVQKVFKGKMTTLQRDLVKGLAEELDEVFSWQEVFEEVSWDSFFKARSVDYMGDEVATAKTTSWNNLKSAIPKEVGGVDLTAMVEEGTLHYVNNFEDYLVDEADQHYTKPPRVMIADCAWEEVCRGLVSSGICSMMPEDQLYHVSGKPLLNGLFGVSKGEVADGYEVHRLIMNLIPVNNLCRGFQGDVSTLPAWSSGGSLHLMPSEQLLISSEDVRCFFYIFRVPENWRRFLGFNKPIPSHLHPGDDRVHYLVSNVLPMGFKNSVSIAQAVHRTVVKRARLRDTGILGPEQELRKDRSFPASETMHRVYLDNFDEMEKVEAELASLVKGTPSRGVLALRAEYEEWGIPRHPKKAVERSLRAEVQGAIVNGDKGCAYPKPGKILKYTQLALMTLKVGKCSQKEMQVIAGGLVYIATFRRTLMGGLNAIWQFIESFNSYPPVIRLEIPPLVHLEISRFLALLPLARLDFRCEISGEVTASDASTTGGGVTASLGLTNIGHMAASCPIRGDLPEVGDMTQVLTIGLFDGIGALRVAADSVGLPVAGHISVEVNQSASRVLESKFPSTVFVPDVESIDENMTKEWACQFSQVGLVLLGAGPPCQGVSGLNADRRGALRDHRSKLYTHVSRVKGLLCKSFPWAQVHSLMESVKSMDEADRAVMSQDIGTTPYAIDASGVSLARRPRLYWLSWELEQGEGAEVYPPPNDDWTSFGTVDLQGDVDSSKYLIPGWRRMSVGPLPTFTTSRPRTHPGRKPAGVDKLTTDEYAQWEEDWYRFPPYQYQLAHQVQKGSVHRLVNIEEREVIMGFPRHYTTQCMPKSQQGTTERNDLRLTLVGNSWNVTVVAWLIAQLGARLGLISPLSVQDCIDLTAPGCQHTLPTFLSRPLMRGPNHRLKPGNARPLVCKLLNLVSIKGEDILLSAPTEETLRYHRLRASIPSNLWRWRTICGWSWKGQKEHINVLELCAGVTCCLVRATLEGHETKGYQAPSSSPHRLVSVSTHAYQGPYQLQEASSHASAYKRFAFTLPQHRRVDLCSHSAEPSRRPFSKGSQAQMGKKIAQLEGRTKAERKAVRQKLGSLRDLTIQPKTRARYDAAIQRFHSYLRSRELVLPKQRALLDSIVSDYLEYIWMEGEGRSLASDTIAALQHYDPKVKGQLAGSWRLLKTWVAHEIPCRAPPFTEEALRTMVGHALFHQRHAFALSLLLGFYGLLRTGELLSVKARDIAQVNSASIAVISLGLTKAGQRVGAAESITLTEEDTLRRLYQWKTHVAPGTSLCPSPHQWRKLFNDTVKSLKLEDYQYRPYSLRRGGATFYFNKHGQLDRLLVQGCWQSSKTARLYVNSGLAILAENQLTLTAHAKVFHNQFLRSRKLPLPKLDLAHKGRAGGHGSKNSKSKKQAKQRKKELLTGCSPAWRGPVILAFFGLCLLRFGGEV